MTSSRDGAEPPRTLTELLAADHDVAEQSLRAIVSHVEAGDFAHALAECLVMEPELRRHIAVEEEIVFPVFELRLGMVGGATLALREEHREIERAMALMSGSLAAGSAPGFQDAYRSFEATFVDHARREETLLYPSLDGALSTAETEKLAQRLRHR